MNERNNTGALHHVEINVSELSRSTAFWGWLFDLLGYEEFQQWDAGKSWISGDTYIVLVQTRKKHLSKLYNRCDTGLNHLAFTVESPAAVDTIANLLRDKGITLLYDDKYPHAGGSANYAVFFEDPDRIKIEITSST
jgi:catechol 2,3-dioxygenase-like lactoylglutathione lyase family enzyme